MLKKFKVSNFCSIGETQELSFEISDNNLLDDSARHACGHAVNLIECVIGANASGKTNLLKALTFILIYTRNSYTFKDQIAFDVHALKQGQPACFELEFASNQKLYQYKASINEDYIESEFFGENVKRGFTRIFEYYRNGDDWTFKKANQLEINKADLKRFKERKVSSVLSSLLSLGYLPKITFFEAFYSNVDRFGLNEFDKGAKTLEVSDILFGDDELKNAVLDFINEFDIGIDDFEFKALKYKDKEGRNKTQQLLDTKHLTDNGSFNLSLYQESNGTQAAIYLLTLVLPVLREGGLVVLDEIESGMHPHVVRKVINLFASKKHNPNNAQLFFSTHQHLLLNDRTKSQIYIAEKNSNNAETELYRLDEVEGVRNDENYMTKYLSGTYGGIPEIDFF